MEKRFIRVWGHVVHGCAHMEHPFHLTYLGAYFVEGHGFIAVAAGGCFGVMFVLWVRDLVDVWFGEE